MEALTAQWVAFANKERIAQGSPAETAAAVKRHTEQHSQANLLIFDAISSEQIEVDLRGSTEDVVQRVSPAEQDSEPKLPVGPTESAKKAGRPKLGVKAREITLLPKHWEWLAEQPGSASVTLRKLVHQAMTESQGKQSLHQVQESVFRFINAIAGNEVNFEEVTRALYAEDFTLLQQLIAEWPNDIAEHLRSLLTRLPE